jgi:hypothetical protein
MEQMKVYPNPSNGNVVVAIGARDAADARLTLVNTLGMPVWEEKVSLNKGNNVLRIDLKKKAIPASGVYHLQVQGLATPLSTRIMLLNP